eukprot:TRINITY_DN7936_c0_g2_i1.p1 TRINITY_DN7936_c0_g2~~TRINITY_DN7936_c0_g2_i1.p1  ORF type:complete len:441 (+),score=74.20 TRINITY_DN7936_c0_g2_i1:86-1408(+)
MAAAAGVAVAASGACLAAAGPARRAALGRFSWRVLSAVSAAAGRAVAAARRAVAAARAVPREAFAWDGQHVTTCSELSSCTPLIACSVGRRNGRGAHYAAIQGGSPTAVRCAGHNSSGQLGTGGYAPRARLSATHPELIEIAAVACGEDFTVALESGGALRSWGDYALGRRGVGNCAHVVGGLPSVAVLGVGSSFVIVVTRSDEAYGWGQNWHGQLALGQNNSTALPQRIASLRQRGLRRLACTAVSVVAEAAAELLWWGWDGDQKQLLPATLHGAGGICFPLRGVGLSGHDVTVADATGRAWCGSISHRDRGPFRVIELEGERAVAVAACSGVCVVLTDEDRLYDIYAAGRGRALCRQINRFYPQLPRGLVPYGGAGSDHIVLVPDHCGGKERLRVFARVAARRGVPADPLRSSLTPFMVSAMFLGGPPNDPFGAASSP